MNVLVIDDQPAIHWVFQAILGAEGNILYTAGNGEEGLRVLEKQAIDLIFCDVDMPVMDGFEFARSLREDPRFSKIPLVFISGRNTSEYRREALRLGAVDFLTKPFGPETIRDIITGLVSKEKILA